MVFFFVYHIVPMMTPNESWVSDANAGCLEPCKMQGRKRARKKSGDEDEDPSTAIASGSGPTSCCTTSDSDSNASPLESADAGARRPKGNENDRAAGRGATTTTRTEPQSIYARVRGTYRTCRRRAPRSMASSPVVLLMKTKG